MTNAQWTPHEDRPTDAWWAELDGAHADVWRVHRAGTIWFDWQVTDRAGRTVQTSVGISGAAARQAAARALRAHVDFVRRKAAEAAQLNLPEVASHGR